MSKVSSCFDTLSSLVCPSDKADDTLNRFDLRRARRFDAADAVLTLLLSMLSTSHCWLGPACGSVWLFLLMIPDGLLPSACLDAVSSG